MNAGPSAAFERQKEWQSEYANVISAKGRDIGPIPQVVISVACAAGHNA
jgi:hypothetical protein